MRLTIDTNIFIKAFDEAEYSMDCDIFVIGSFVSNPERSLTLDFEDSIRKEYCKNLSSNQRFIKIYTALELQGRISFISGKIDKIHKDNLISLGFHEPEDHAFVGTAVNADRILITEDSDYGKGPNQKAQTPEKIQVLQYMSDTMKLQVLDSIEAKLAV